MEIAAKQRNAEKPDDGVLVDGFAGIGTLLQ